MSLDEVGARLTLIGASETITQLNAVADAYDRLAAAQDRAAEAAAASGDTQAAASKKVAASADVAAASSDTQAAAASRSAEVTAAESDAAAVAITRKQAQADATRGLSDAQKGLVIAQAGVLKSNDSLSKSIDNLAKGPIGKFGKWGLVGGLGVLYEGIKQYTDFQKAMTQSVTQAGLPKGELPWLSEQTIQNAKRTGVALNDVAAGAYRVVSATSGLHDSKKQLEEMLQAGTNLAVLFQTPSGFDTEQAYRLIGGLMNFKKSGGAGVKSPQQAEALLNAAVGLGDMRGSDLVGAMGRGIMQSARVTGANLPDMLTLLDLMTRFNAQPSQAGTLLSHAVQMLATPSAQGQKAESMLGIQQGQLRQIMAQQGMGSALKFFYKKIEGGLNPLSTLLYGSVNSSTHLTGNAAAQAQLMAWQLDPAILQKLNAHQQLSPQQQTTWMQFMMTKMFGGARQELPLITAMMNLPMFSQIRAKMMQMANPQTFGSDLTIAMNTPAQKLKQFEQDLHVFLVELGKDVTPAALDALHGLLDIAEWFGKNKWALDALLGGLGTMVGVGISAVAVSKILKMVQAFKTLASLGQNLGSFLTGGIIPKAAGSTGLAQAAANTQLEAAQLQLEAAQLRYNNVVPGGAAAGAGAAEGAAAGEAGEAGLFGAGGIGLSGLASTSMGLGVTAAATISGIGALLELGESSAANKITNPYQRIFDLWGIKHPLGSGRAQVPLGRIAAEHIHNAKQLEEYLKKYYGNSDAKGAVSPYKTPTSQLVDAAKALALNQGVATALSSSLKKQFNPYSMGISSDNNSEDRTAKQITQDQQDAIKIFKDSASGDLKPAAAQEKDAAAIQKLAAQMGKEAAKMHGDAAKQMQTAAETMMKFATEIANMKINVNISGTQLAKTVATATAGKVARS